MKNITLRKYIEIFLLVFFANVFFLFTIFICKMLSNSVRMYVLVTILILYIIFMYFRLNKIYKKEKLINCVKLSCFLLILLIVFLGITKLIPLKNDYKIEIATFHLIQSINFPFIILINIVNLIRAYRNDKNLIYLLVGLSIQVLPFINTII